MSNRTIQQPLETAASSLPISPHSMTPEAKRTRFLLLSVVIFGLLLIGFQMAQGLQTAYSSAIPTSTPAAGVFPYDSPRLLADFTMPSSSGAPLSLSDLRGKFTLLFFGYTHCPDFCPATLARWKQIKAALGADAAEMNFLFISVDGARDTPQVLKDYLSRFDPDFIGMSGDDATLGRIGKDYGLYYQLHTEEGANYSVDHNTQSYLVDPQGRLIDLFSFDAEPSIIVAVIENQFK